MNLTTQLFSRRAGATLFAGVVISTSVALAATMSIEDVMKKYHKGKDALCKKVSGGQASKAELQQILAGYQAMSSQKPPKGDAASWKSKNEALITATQSIIAGKPEGIEKYKAAVNCKACHNAHKGD